MYDLPPSLPARLAIRIVIREDTGCWLYGPAGSPGYRQIRWQGRKLGAHRLFYSLLIGPIPDGLPLDHLCHTADESCAGGTRCPHRPCVNPSHLEPVTHRLNSLRGRGVASANAAKTYCPQGHPYDADNTYLYPDGRRRTCRICRRASQRRYEGWQGGVHDGKRTHCPAGHEFTAENTYVNPKNARICRTCNAEAQRRYQARKAAVKKSEKRQ